MSGGRKYPIRLVETSNGYLVIWPVVVWRDFDTDPDPSEDSFYVQAFGRDGWRSGGESANRSVLPECLRATGIPPGEADRVATEFLARWDERRPDEVRVQREGNRVEHPDPRSDEDEAAWCEYVDVLDALDASELSAEELRSFAADLKRLANRYGLDGGSPRS